MKSRAKFREFGTQLSRLKELFTFHGLESTLSLGIKSLDSIN